MLAGGQVVSLKYTTDHDACYGKIQCSTLCGSIVSHQESILSEESTRPVPISRKISSLLFTIYLPT